MKQSDLTRLNQALALAVRQSSVIAEQFRGSVANIGKQMALEPEVESSDRLRAGHLAKTKIDEVIQDLLILSISPFFKPDQIKIDAEEDTQFSHIYSQKQDGLTLVIDPIDGTLNYLENSDYYSICAALITDQQMLSVFVFFPARNKCFFLGPDGVAYLSKDFLQSGLDSMKPIQPPAVSDQTSDAQQLIYCHRRVPKQIVSALRQNGFTVIVDHHDADVGIPDCLGKCLTGEARAYIDSGSQLRDILLAPIVAHSPGGFEVDFAGNSIKWPAGGTLSEGMFGFGDPSDIVASIT